MADEDVTRRLTTIVAADVAGYSRLIGVDEEGTLAALRAHRHELIDAQIADHGGRIVNTAGDSILIEFPSVIEALRCAIEVQRAMAVRNRETLESRRIEFRVGINVGDVMEQDGDLLGDGVNVAARLEGLAEPGGICLSRAARDQVRDLMEIALEDLGEVKVKNIARPVRAFRVLPEGEAAATQRWQLPTIPRTAAAVVVLLVAITGASLWWWRPWVERIEPADQAKMEFPLPDKPSIAVLPFNNLSGNPEQEFLADGLTENIISALSMVPDLFVIARASVFTYKGTAVKVQQVAEEMGVRYVVEGSMQRTDDQIRVTAQLVDAINGYHLWSQTYDRRLANLFAVQDDITLRIVSALHVEITEGEYGRLRYRSTDNLQAWGNLVKGIASLRHFTKVDIARARNLFEAAIQLDPQFDFAWTMLGWTHWNDARNGWGESWDGSFNESLEATKKALSLNPDDSSARALLGSLHLLQRDYEKAISEGEKAVALAPSIPEHYAVLAISTFYAGDFERTVALTKKAMRLHPNYPGWYSYRIGVGHMMLGQFEDAITALSEWYDTNPSHYIRKISLATALSMAARVDEARALVNETLESEPSYSLERHAKMHYFKNPEHLDRILAALRQAGLPEGARNPE